MATQSNDRLLSTASRLCLQRGWGQGGRGGRADGIGVQRAGGEEESLLVRQAVSVTGDGSF